MRLLDIYDLPVVDSPQTGSGTPSNVQQHSIEFSAELTIILIIAAIIFAVIVIALSIEIHEKKRSLKRLEQFTTLGITEEEQDLINNFRKLNPQGKAIVNDTCKNLTDRGATRKNENDGV